MTNTYIITGGRSFGDLSDKAMTGSAEYHQRFKEYNWVRQQIHDFFIDHSNDGGNNLKFVFGDARGVDSAAWDYCTDSLIEYQRYRADWDKHGRSAGPIRNEYMLTSNLDGLKGILAFPGGRGTANMIGLGEQYAIPIYQYYY